jgi:hypothetical protein
MTTAEFVTAAKSRLGLSSVDTFDTMLEGFVEFAAKRLFPRTGKEIAPQTVDVSVDEYGMTEVNMSSGLTTDIKQARRVEAMASGAWEKVSKTYHHAGVLEVRGLSTDVTQLKIYGLDVLAPEDVPEELHQAIIWYVMSEFYDTLAGDKSSYNIYQQTNGARAVDNMLDESALFEQRADSYVEKQAMIYGSA